jgi:2-phospho-L-lactate/phosphoenolpyruvate guanylyltransferase
VPRTLSSKRANVAGVVRGDGVAGGSHERPRWVVVVPVKPLGAAKSRLDRFDRADVALAMATDTVAAARAVTEEVAAVVVVTDDERAGRTLAGDGVLIVPDTPDAGLNPALAHGASVAARHWPAHGVATLSADLAALRPGQLRRALRAAARYSRAVVADATGTGTVLLTVLPGIRLEPAFGPGSWFAHTAGGAIDLTAELGGDIAGLRRDVDTVADLADAVALGVGPATTRLLAAPPRPPEPARGAGG